MHAQSSPAAEVGREGDQENQRCRILRWEASGRVAGRRRRQRRREEGGGGEGGKPRVNDFMLPSSC